MSDIKKILSRLPHSPWIYQFLNVKWEVIYVGKSKNLKSRVSSYFSWQQKLNFAKKKMVWYISDIKYIVTNNEVESLLLENNLIKELQPKYNILLKDDKNFLYIKITKEEYPKVVKTRIPPKSNGKQDGYYYWPYTSGFYVNELLKILKKVFWYGVGNHHFFRKSAGYTLDKYIFKGNIETSQKEIQNIYEEKIQEIKKFLAGNTKDMKELLQKEMLSYASQHKFEEAQKRKISLEAIESLDNFQLVREWVKGDYFIVQVLEKYESHFIGCIEVVDSKIRWFENYEVTNILGENKKDILKKFIEQKWIEFKDSRKISFIAPEEVDTIAEIHVEVPELWSKYELLKLCYKNMYEFAHKKYIASLSTKIFSKKTMTNILDVLGYEEINSEILFECNDISHLSWNHTVASRSIIENGKKNPKKYKKFRIKTLSEGKIDDFNSMREIMTRRLAELEKVWNYPDLIVIDGWKWQLSSVMEIIEDFPEKHRLQIVSIAKREEELFLPWNPTPILLEKDSQELRLIQMLRDEAHRFAISFNRDSRSKSQKKNILESIPGIWPVTRKKIFQKYGSVSWLQKVEKKELEEVLGKSVTENLENHGII